MEQKRVAIYCRINNRNDIILQRSALDGMFFRLAAYAHSHKLHIAAYYEDIVLPTDDTKTHGLTKLLADSSYMNFTVVLVTKISQIPIETISEFPIEIQSLDSLDRAHRLFQNK